MSVASVCALQHASERTSNGFYIQDVKVYTLLLRDVPKPFDDLSVRITMSSVIVNKHKTIDFIDSTMNLK